MRFMGEETHKKVGQKQQQPSTHNPTQERSRWLTEDVTKGFASTLGTGTGHEEVRQEKKSGKQETTNKHEQQQ